jgi:hypothetical protein
MAWFKTVEDKVFKASRVTHVANAYIENLHVKVTADIRYLEEDIGVSIAGYGINHGKNVWEKCRKNGFTKIAPKNSFKFEPDTSNSAYVYITIVTDSGEVICDAVSKTVNASVIVDRSGNLQDAEMGSIWTDTNGKCHK